MSRGVNIIIALAAIGVVGGAGLLLRSERRNLPVAVKLQIRVTPPEQVEFVAAQAGSTRFKYLAGKQAGVPPAVAQRLTTRLTPNSPLLEAEIRLAAKDEAERYGAGFIDALQTVCGTQAQVTLAGQTIH